MALRNLLQGLFEVPQLGHPSGFSILKENAIAEAEGLIAEACSPTRKRKMVCGFDQLILSTWVGKRSRHHHMCPEREAWQFIT